MHRSRLFGLFVDAPIEDAPKAVDFWANALGATPKSDGDAYTALTDAIDGFAMVVQAVDDTPRFHVDIETDDIEAETARLIGLGATEETRHESWVILRAPGGHLVCVVSPQSSAELFDARARTWDTP